MAYLFVEFYIITTIFYTLYTIFLAEFLDTSTKSLSFYVELFFIYFYFLLND